MTEKLTLDGVSKSFGEAAVLQAVDLIVEDHEVVCLIGSSGSGKSTLLKCVDLLIPIDAGRVLLDGEDITAPGVNADVVRQRMSIVFQAFNLFPHMSVIDNVTIGPRRVLGVNDDEAQADAMALLDRFGLAEKAGDYPDRLSGGQQQRVAIVRALACGPELILLDEVTSALDPELVAEVLGVIRELKTEGMTMLIATHEMGFARDVADTVCFLDQGQILEHGPPRHLFENPQKARTRQFLDRIISAGRL